MKTVVIYFSLAGERGYPLDKSVPLVAYTRLMEAVKKAGHNAVIARADSYQGKGQFQRYYSWVDSSKSLELHEGTIRADLIFNRDSENTIPEITDCPMLNHFEFDNLCRDKYATYELFPDAFGVTVAVDSFDDVGLALKQIPSSRVVLKPRHGEQGRGVFILDKADISKDIYSDWNNTILQEFIDSSDGIPGLVDGISEVNLYLVDGEFAGARVRQPPAGDLLLNETTVASHKLWGIHFDQLPPSLWDTAKKLDDNFSRFSPRLFRADFVRDKEGKFKLLELNSRPGIMYVEREGKDFYRDFNDPLERSIIRALNESN